MDTRWPDLARLAWGALAAHRLRSALTMLGILIGIASVILLTSIGEGTRLFILSEFTQFGTNLLSVNPGKTMTTGQPGALAGTFRQLTLGDVDALRRVPGVLGAVPSRHPALLSEAGSRAAAHRHITAQAAGVCQGSARGGV